MKPREVKIWRYWVAKALHRRLPYTFYSSSVVPKGLLGSPASSSIDGEYEFNDVEEVEGLLSGDEFDSEEEEEMSMEVKQLLTL